MEAENVRSNGIRRTVLIPFGILLVVLLGAAVGFTALTGNPDSRVLTQDFSEPLGNATSAKVEIDPGDGNLSIDPIRDNQAIFASGSLQYAEKQGLPVQSVTANGNQVNLTWKANQGSGQSWLRLPWDACNNATDWQVHLNPHVSMDLYAHTAGGNVSLNLAEMTVTRLLTETGGGNVTLVLPDRSANLNAIARTGAGDVTVTMGREFTGSSSIEARSGAGNVEVRLPKGSTGRIHATAGMGKVIVDPSFQKIDDSTYQTADYETAKNRVEITVQSGAGNVNITTK